MIEVIAHTLVAAAAMWLGYKMGFADGIARANDLARDEHAADGFHVSEETQP